MPFKVIEAYPLVLERVTVTPDGNRIETSMSIEDEKLGVALPTSLSLAIAFDWKSDDRSTVTCTGEVLDTSRAVVSTGAIDVAPVAASGHSTLPLSRFRVTVTGTYTLRLYAGGALVSTELVAIESV